jgi:hypothetical protein
VDSITKLPTSGDCLDTDPDAEADPDPDASLTSVCRCGSDALNADLERIRRVDVVDVTFDVDVPVNFDFDFDLEFDSARERERGRNSLLVVGNGGAAARGDDMVRSMEVWDAGWDSERLRFSGIIVDRDGECWPSDKQIII